MTMRLIRSADYQRMPWKNGGGETLQIAIDEQARGLDDFSWRVSMARVAADGPFSMFPGVDRTLCILEGIGMDLSIAQATPLRLDVHTPPLAFPADAAVHATLPDGAILDLNVMTRRDRARHRVRRLHCAQGQDMRSDGDVTLLLPRGAGLGIDAGAARLSLADGDCLLVDRKDSALLLKPSAPISLYIVDLWMLR